MDWGSVFCPPPLVATRSPQESVKETPKARKQLVITRYSPRESFKETPKAKKQLVSTRSSPRKLFCHSASSSKITNKSVKDDAHGFAEKQPKSTLPCPRSHCKEMGKELAELKERYGELNAKYRRLQVNRRQPLGKLILVTSKNVFGKGILY